MFRNLHRWRCRYHSHEILPCSMIVGRNNAIGHHRYFWSSSNDKNEESRRSKNSSQSSAFQLYALPFSISPKQAWDKFMKWAEKEQGLQYLLREQSTILTAAFCPVWTFDVNIRFVLKDKATGRRRLDWKPDMFSVYGTQSVVHIPGLSTYAGYNYPRSLLNPIHNTTLVFLGDKITPWGKWMLRDIKGGGRNGEDIKIMPDPFNATRSRALTILKQELTGIAQQAPDGYEVQLQTEIVQSRRVYMPTYVIDYSILGVSYQAFVSGADVGSEVSGVSHTIWETSHTQNASQGLQGFFSNAFAVFQQTARRVGGQRALSIVVVILQFLGQFLGRVAIRLPWIAALGGLFVGFRKFVQPFFGSRWTSAAWERQREHEATMDEREFDHNDDFVDSGVAQRFFQANRGRILRHFTGQEPEHESGDYDFYRDWEEWARRMFYQQQRQNYSYRHEERQHQQRVHRQQAPPRSEYQWDFDPNDPYSVLGIKRGATKQEVSAAFRREMLKYHPDTLQASNASDAERRRSTERSKLISEAYRKIKSETT
ncbi:hypothetical protein ACA910_004996 [Epithemia clementina (nom. ined.)]